MARIKRKGNFTTVLNAFIRDKDITFKAKGVFTYMSSFSDEWNFTLKSMAAQSKDGIGGIRSSIKELKDHGYLDYQKNKDGTGVYTLYDEPVKVSKSQSAKKPLWEKAKVEKPQRIKKNNSSKKNKTSKKNKLQQPKKPLQDAKAPVLREINSSKPKASILVWQAYKQAYNQRYGADPVRNAMVNGQIANFVKRVPEDEAPNIAAYYVTSNNSYYAGRGHSVGILLSDAEKLCTEYRTGNRQTQTRVRQQDQSQSNYDAIQEAKLILQGMNNE